jgi:hypothetical protein
MTTRDSQQLGCSFLLLIFSIETHANVRLLEATPKDTVKSFDFCADIQFVLLAALAAALARARARAAQRKAFSKFCF